MKTKTIQCVCCTGTGEVCGGCGEVETNCRLCAAFEPMDCDDCAGTGRDVVSVREAPAQAAVAL